MPFDSLVRTKQINKPEFSGYIVDVLLQYLRTGQITGIATNTGQLTGQFYPRWINPLSYVTESGLYGYATQSDVTSNNTSILAYVDNNYYPSSNPDNYVTSDNLAELGTISGDFSLMGAGGVIVTGIGNNVYISGLGTNALDNYVPWDYFDSGQNLSLNYLQLNTLNWPDVLGGSFLFKPDSYFLLVGGRQGYPSENHVIDLFGSDVGIPFNRSSNRPYILGFDIEAYSISSSGYRVLTTNDATGYATKTELRTTSGVLADENWRTHTEINDYITGVPSLWMAPTQLTGTIRIIGQNGISVTKVGQNVIIGGSGGSSTPDINLVHTIGDEDIYGVKTFRGGVSFRDEHLNILPLLWTPSTDSLAEVFVLSSTDGSTYCVDVHNRRLCGTNGLPVLDWNKKALTGTWDSQGLTVGGIQVVTRNMTGTLVPTSITGSAFYPRYGNPANYLTQVEDVVYITGYQTILGWKEFSAGIMTSTVESEGVDGFNIYLDAGTINEAMTLQPLINFPLRMLTGTWDAQGLTVSGIPVVTKDMTGQFITTALTGVLVPAGITGNAFYPRFGNPAGYLTAAAGGGGVSSLVVTGTSMT
jgi:hypothetical protein